MILIENKNFVFAYTFIGQYLARDLYLVICIGLYPDLYLFRDPYFCFYFFSYGINSLYE
jgi:hypothetical protein